MLRRLAVTQVTLVIQPDSENLRRLARMEQLHVGKPVLGAGFFPIAEQIAANLADGVAIENSVSGGGTGAVANVFRHFVFSLCGVGGGCRHRADELSASGGHDQSPSSDQKSQRPEFLC